MFPEMFPAVVVPVTTAVTVVMYDPVTPPERTAPFTKIVLMSLNVFVVGVVPVLVLVVRNVTVALEVVESVRPVPVDVPTPVPVHEVVCVAVMEPVAVRVLVFVSVDVVVFVLVSVTVLVFVFVAVPEKYIPFSPWTGIRWARDCDGTTLPSAAQMSADARVPWQSEFVTTSAVVGTAIRMAASQVTKKAAVLM